MAMSRDRVKFTIPYNRLMAGSGSGEKLRQLLIEVFNVRIPANQYGPVEITCRPSQFARFLILRNDRGLLNGFKELNPKLFTPRENQSRVDDTLKIDVATNPNRVVSEPLDD